MDALRCADKEGKKMLTNKDLDALDALAEAATPNWTEWKAKDNADWVSPQTYVVAERENGDEISVVRFFRGEPQFWCTIGKSEWEWCNAAFIAAANPYTIKKLVAMARKTL